MKFKALTLAILLLCSPVRCFAQEEYDSRHTVLALNMAIVSVQRIINTNDRAVLDMEYKNIINNLKLGNIESDKEIIELYQELLNTISNKTLNEEAAARVRESYNNYERAGIFKILKIILGALPGIRAEGANLPEIAITFAVSLASSLASSYFEYRDIVKKHKEILYEIDVEEQKSYNVLQTKLLNSSWKLLRKYKLPDEYRIVQASVNDFLKAVNEPDDSKSFQMLRVLKDEFKIYPPYWIYRAKAAQRLGDDSEAAKCFDEFDKVYRPVLRNDPFKLEAAKYRVMEAVKSGNNNEALAQLGIVRANTLRSDWADNLFAGVMYFVLGEKEKGINCVEVNINFDSEKEISSIILAHMKAGEIDAVALTEELDKLISRTYDGLLLLAENKNINAMLELGGLYMKGEVVGKDYKEAAKWFEKAAYEGSKDAQTALANLYFEGGPDFRKSYYDSYIWCCVAEMQEAYYSSLPAKSDSAIGIADAAVTGTALVAGGGTLFVVSSIIGVSIFWPVAVNIGIAYMAADMFNERSLKEQIEGEGIFNLAKLSKEEMNKAKSEAEKIMAQIEANIKHRLSLQ